MALQKRIGEGRHHAYQDNRFTAKGANDFSLSGEGTIDVAVVNDGKGGPNRGMLFTAEAGKKLDVNVGTLKVQSNVIIGTKGDKSTANVAAKNIIIGDGQFTAGTNSQKEHGRANLTVGGKGGAPYEYDGAGTSVLGNESSNILVNEDGKLRLVAGKESEIDVAPNQKAKVANAIHAASVTVNGGVLSFANEDATATDLKSEYKVGTTNVNDGFVSIKNDSGLTIKGGDFNIKGNSHFELDGKVKVSDATVSVADTSVMAASNGSTSATVDLQPNGTLKLSKDKLKEFLTGFKSDGSKVQYKNEYAHFKDPNNELKDAAKGSVALQGGAIEFIDESVELADDSFVFGKAETDKPFTQAGQIGVSSGLIRGKNISISKKIDNAKSLMVDAEHLQLGSSSFDSSSSALGVGILQAESVDFIANQPSGNYTLQDHVYLNGTGPQSLKGGLKITTGSLSISGSGGDYTLEPGKDLILSNSNDASDVGSQKPDATPQSPLLQINNGSLKISGKLEISGKNSFSASNGTFDARNASSYKVTSASVNLNNGSSLHLDGRKVLTLADNGVEFKEDSFASDTFVNDGTGAASTVYLHGLGSMNMKQFEELKTKTNFEGFFDGFTVSSSDVKPEMDIKDVLSGTPDVVYAGTQVAVSGAVDKNVSVGSIKLTDTNTLEIGGDGSGGGDGSTQPVPPPTGKTSSTVKLTNAGANGNAHHNFVQSSDGSLAGVTLNELQATLQLQGSGNIGSISGKADNKGHLFIGSRDGSTAGNVTVKGDIGGSQGLYEVQVRPNSQLTINGSTVKTSKLSLDKQSQVNINGSTASNVDVDVLTLAQESKLNAPSATVSIGSFSHIQGDLTAKELKATGGRHVIEGNSTVAVDSLIAGKSAYIQIGDDSAKGNAGNIIAKEMKLNGGTLFVDPDFNAQASYAVVGQFDNNDPHNVGTLNGQAIVGKNAVLAIGFENKADVVSIIKEKLGSHGGFVQGSGAENALVLNKGIKLNENDRIVVDSSATPYDPTNPTSGKPTPTDVAVKLGANASIVVTDNVYSNQGQVLTGTAIELSPKNNKVETAPDTVVILSGKFSKQDKGIKIFSGASNLPELTVKSVNGLLQGNLNASGEVDSLTFQKKLFDDNYKHTSKPVRDLMSKVIATGGKDVYEDEKKSGAQFIATAANQSINGAEVDRAAHAAVFAGSQQAALAAVSTFSDAMNERALNAANTQNSRNKIAQQYHNASAQAQSNSAQDPANTAQALSSINGMWAAPHYKRSQTDGFNSDGADYGADIDMKGFTIGTDVALDNVTIGTAATYGQGEAQGQGSGERIKDEFDYYGLGVYASVAMGKLSLIGDASYNWMKHDISGKSGFASFGNISTSTDSKAFRAGITAKYLIETPYFALTPHFGTRFTRLETDAYELNTAKGVIAQTDMDVQNILSIPVGVGISQNFYNNGWIISPSADLTISFNQGDTESKYHTKFTGLRKGLDLNTEIMDDVTYGIKLGVGATNGNFSTQINLNYDGSENTDNFGVNANVGYNF